MLDYLHITFTMRPDSEASATYGLPEWLADVLNVDDSGPIAAEDGDYEFAYREVIASGAITSDQLARLRDEWCLDTEDAVPCMGFLGDLGDGLPRMYADERHDIDGMDWNMGGYSPIMFATLSIVGPDAAPAA
jgi:hypothetical protein